MKPNHGRGAERSKVGMVFRWWFFPLMFLVFFLPPIAQRGFTPETWSNVIDTTLGQAPIYRMTFLSPYIHTLFLLILVLALVRPARFMPYFSAYAAVSYFVFAVVQNVAWSGRFGFSVVTSNFIWFSLAGVAWGVEALSPPNPERRLRFHRWHLWAIPLCVFAFWAPEEPWYFHPKYLIWNISTLAFCLMTPVFVTVHASYYPLASAVLLRVTGCAGVAVGLINLLNAYFRNGLYHGAMHVPLLMLSGLALVLAHRQRRLQRDEGPPDVAANEASTVPDAAVAVRGLSKSYGDKTAVDTVSFEVAYGELFGLLGPNGAGKTTTVECIAGLRKPDAGDIHVAGLDPARDAQALRLRLGIQLQKAALPEGLKVGEAVRYFAAFFGGGVDTNLLLDRLGLEACRDTLYGKLSGGQKQRLHFLIALLGDPQVLIVDEPTTGLDPVARQAVWQLLRERTAHGKSVILTTHFMQEAQALCDRLAFIRGGRIIAQGSSEELIRGLGWRVSIALRLDRPCPLEPLRALPGIVKAAQEDSRLVLHGDAASVLNDVLGAVAREGCAVQDVKTQEATLDDVFIALAGEGGVESLPTLHTTAAVVLAADYEQEGRLI